MSQNVTLDQLILFAYNETELTDTALVADSLYHDPETEEDYESILKIKEVMDSFCCEPDKTTLKKILNYSRKSALEV
jgi:hypothetical protein